MFCIKSVFSTRIEEKLEVRIGKLDIKLENSDNWIFKLELHASKQVWDWPIQDKWENETFPLSKNWNPNPVSVTCTSKHHFEIKNFHKEVNINNCWKHKIAVWR